jgi:hypothetical protein
MSFLDVICCGFGAIILLLVLTKIGEPRALEQARRDLDRLVAALQRELEQIRGETLTLERDLRSTEEQLSIERKRVARLRGDLSAIRGRFAASKQDAEVSEIVEGELVAAQQELSEEMKRLLGRTRRRTPQDRLVGGIPVDSEYIIFIIDTSGSMANHTWSLVVQKMAQTLNVYPQVKGIQIMNDMGQYMFDRYAGKWIPDTPGRRKAILERLATWDAFSNSSPVEGVTRAIQAFAAQDKRVSIYVFGDEFTGSSIEDVLRTVQRINRVNPDSPPRVRIHAIGFPVVFLAPEAPSEFTGVRFATLMRALCHENGGTFVGINGIQR